jgi:hypothetical protein
MRTFVILFLLGFFVSCSSSDIENTPEEYTFPVESPGSMK